MSYLDRIFETKREEIRAAIARVSLEELRSQAESRSDFRGFRNRLDLSKNAVSLIAEIKAASPSQGSIRINIDPVSVAKSYANAGADCLSVLTDEQYFRGSVRNLELSRDACLLPVLRKDFICDEYQVYETVAIGADAILLIVAGLDPAQLRGLFQLSSDLGLDVLVEVHDAHEADIALDLGANLIGVNNRNLSTFETSLEVSREILPKLSGVLAVSESSLATHEDIRKVSEWGARSVLIGTTFCSAENVEGKVREVMGW